MAEYFLRDPDQENYAKQLAELDDYLNFFEFVAYLVQLKQVSEKDVSELFGYFLDDLRKDQVLTYISKYGYGNLYTFLTHGGKGQKHG